MQRRYADYHCKYMKDGKNSKHRKAEKYKLWGKDTEIISEEIFYDILDY